MPNLLGAIAEEIPSGKLDFPLASSDKRQTIFRQHRIGSIYDQGERPWCVGYSVLSLLEADPIRQKPFTAEEIYNSARKLGRTPKSVDGAKLTSAIDFLKEKGAVKQDFWTNKAEDIGNYIFTTSPVALSVPWSTRMDKAQSDGRCKPGGDVYGFHAVLAYSFDFLKNRIWLQNSWGREWGRDGCFYLTMRDLDAIMKKGGIACAVTE